ncbi:uncharacterized protein B0H64DRAFT_445186 [Chaetomium fimeti]|uniref:Uncharacterized protein n=1 Tax=Chaetomium fimeti TaxID=1854472 RepID=A0AAE0LP95_9PEZI|nr:hypothetical protein B0H64DRAFT_445186 [Chaetomium fimeti]
MAAVAKGVNGHRRRRCGNVEGKMQMVLARPEETILGVVGDMGKGLCVLKRVMLRFCLSRLVSRQEGPQSLLHDTSHLMDYQLEWELGNLTVIPMDLHRLSEDCRGRRTPTGRVLELDDPNMAEPWASSQLCGLNSLRQSDIMSKARLVEGGRGLGQGLQSVCTRTITTTGFGRNQPRHRIVARPFDATLDGWHEAPPSRRVLMPRVLSQSTSPLSSTGMPKITYSNRLASPGEMQLSVWPNPNSAGLQTGSSMSVRKGMGVIPLGGNPIPHPLREPGVDSDTTLLSTDRGRTAPVQGETHSVKQSQPAAETENRSPQPEPPDWAMRKTMRKSLGNPGPQDEVDTRRSLPTSTRTSTSLTAQSPSPGTIASQNQAADETIARGAARTAFAHHRGGSGWVRTRMPVSAPDPGSHQPHRTRVQAAGTRAKAAAKPGAGAETGSGQGKGQGSQDKGKEEKNEKEKGENEQEAKEKAKKKEKEKEKEKGKTTKADMNNVEVSRWARSAMVMLAKVVEAYWHVVSPVFDGDSQLRKRIDKAQATRGDAVVCVLAVVFLFLAASGGVWAVRGIIWVVRLLGRLGEVLRVVAGLHD